MSKLYFSRYSPSIGGHAPGHVRDAFIDALDQFEAWENGEPEPSIEIDGQALSLSEVCGLVWNCTDIMPAAVRNALKDLLDAHGDARCFRGTYAAGARAAIIYLTH